MKNAEKFKEVFGFAPDMNSCPADDCNDQRTIYVMARAFR